MQPSSNVKETQNAFPATEPKPVEPCPAAQQSAPVQTQAVAPPPAQTATQPAPPPVEEKKERTWVKIELVDSENKPVAGARYSIKVPNESEPRKGVLDSQGQAGYFDLDPGTCEVTFPDFDKDTWARTG